MKAELEALIEQMIARGILFDEAVQEFEKKFILRTLAQSNNNLSKAAVALGIHRNTLSKRLIEYQIGVTANGPHKTNGHKTNGLKASGHANARKPKPAAKQRKARA